MKLDLKRMTLVIILSLLMIFSSVSFAFADTVSAEYFSLFLPYKVNYTYASDYAVDGNTLTIKSTTFVFFQGLEPETTYTVFFYDTVARGGSSVPLRLMSGGGGTNSNRITNVTRGTLDFNGNYTEDGTDASTLNNLKFAIPDDTLASVLQFTTPVNVSNYTLYLNPTGASSSNPIVLDFSKLFIAEGSIDDNLGYIAPTPKMVDRNISVMPGYILVAELCSDGVFSCSSDGLADSPSRFSTRIWETNVQYGQSLTIPSGGTISNSAFLRTVPWTKIDANWLGATNKGQFSTSYTLSDGKYFTVVNPYNWLVEDGGGIKGYHTNVNPVVNCRFSTGVYTYRLYRTSQLWNDVNLIDTSYDRPVFTDNGEAIDHLEHIDGVTEEVLDDNVDPADLPIGSMNGSSSTDIDMGYLFGSGNSNADTLLDGSRGFFEKLGDFFTFMPAEIRTMIVACFGVTMVVAVLKMFF